ncbi:hypothetical protein [Sphingopyxis sp. JAI128]|uniref:hypothetical protein n=1 Tax=Sphingopyxis sp. JAI128 TaxID=2723066 RepID=UPI001617768E|nr:hypothetical protein [Sphingopyxis sp. JAI128]MBB6425236.1 CelD/BcsL family acetyltransferase involved in cellulose biosynthesis [Sphingopyxis sp. JAI128]
MSYSYTDALASRAFAIESRRALHALARRHYIDFAHGSAADDTIERVWGGETRSA